MSTTAADVSALLSKNMLIYGTTTGKSVMANGYLCTHACLHSFFPTTLLLMTISAFIIALFYLYAKLTQNPQLDAWSKLEVAEMLNTLVILVVVVVVINAFCASKVGIFAPKLVSINKNFANDNLFSGSVRLLTLFSHSCAKYFYIVVASHSLLVMAATYVLSASPIAMGVSFGAFKPLMDVLNAFYSMGYIAMSLGYITVLAQIHVLNLTQYLFMVYLLPIGFALRCFLPTRKFGGSLIALGLVFLIFYPLLIILFYQTLVISAPIPPNPVQVLLKSAANYKVIFWLLKWFGSAANYVAFESIAIVFTGGVLFPMLMTIIIIAGARQLTRTLGEEMDITNITRMI